MKRLLKFIVTFSILTTFSNAEFIDIDNTHWGYEAVCNMAEKNVLSGYPDGDFKPEKNITIGEYASIFAKFFDIEENTVDNYFVSINKEYWSKGNLEAIREYIQPNYDNISEFLGDTKSSYEYGIISNMPVTREIVIYSLGSILAFDNSNYVKGEESLFADYEKILYPQMAVLLYKQGIISGEKNNDKIYLAPDRYITRVEIASIFNKLLNNGEKITNTEKIENFEIIINNIVNLMKEYKLNEVKKYIYDSGNVLEKYDFNKLLTKDIKNVINRYFNKLQYNITEIGFYSYNKAYVKIEKSSYDYNEMLKPLKSIKSKELENIVKEIDGIASKQKLKVLKTTQTINFIKNNNEWKIEL